MGRWWTEHARIVEFVRWAMDEQGLSAEGVFARFEKPWQYDDEYQLFLRQHGVDETRPVSGVARIRPPVRADGQTCPHCLKRYYYAPHGACPYCREPIEQEA